MKPFLKKTIQYIFLILLLLVFLRIIDFGFLLLNQQGKVIFYPPNVTAHSDSKDYYYTFKTNSLGIRNPEITEKKGKRILVLGDSFVFGWGVNEEYTFVRLAEKKLQAKDPNITLVNTGIPNTGPENYLPMYRALRDKLKPDLVVTVLYPNDVTDSGPTVFLEAIKNALSKKKTIRFAFFIMPKASDYFLKYFLARMNQGINSDAESTTLQKQNDSPPPPPKILTAEQVKTKKEEYRKLIYVLADSMGVKKDRVSQWLIEIGDENLTLAAEGKISPKILLTGLLSPDFYEENLDLKKKQIDRYGRMLELIDTIRKETSERKEQFGLVYIPSELQYDAKKTELHKRLGVITQARWLKEVSALEQSLKEYADKNQISYLNLTSIFREESRKKELNFPFDLHLNNNGNAVVVEPFVKFIEGFEKTP
ncbi:MAG: hypothetical protein KBF93_25375 [Leptospiraceae bacterium]|nr:hypothetical protein [Leptospiraceae bacterium]